MRKKVQTIQEYLGVPPDWKIRERVKHSISIHPNKQDIKTAKPREPRACALHNAACRMYDIPNCAIGGRWAYIPQRDPDGTFYIARMQAPQDTQRAIRKFDKTGAMPEGGFIFVPIAKSHSLAAKKKYNKHHNAKLREIKQAEQKVTVTRGSAAPAKKRKLVTRRRSEPLRSIPRQIRL